MTTTEILQAAIDEGCDIEIETMSSGVYIEFKSSKCQGWTDPMPTLETAVASAWQHYQTNKQ